MKTVFTAALAVLLIISGPVRAEEKDPRPDMHAMASEIIALEKFLISDAEFSAPANESAISGSLGRLNEHLMHLGRGTFAQNPALKVNLSLLQSHVKDAERAFHEKNKPFARYMMQSSLQMCIACHTRKGSMDFVLPEKDTVKLAPMELGDYLFATRQFQNGREVYEKIVSGYPNNGTGQSNLRKALLSLAVFYARVKEDPKGGRDYFHEVSQIEKIPVYVREESNAWSKEFDSWSKKQSPKDANLTEFELMKKAKALLRHDDFTMLSELGRSFHVRRLHASSILHRVLEAPGDRSPMKAEALLYLGQIYPRLSSDLFFRFGDMYLKACISDYPKTSGARACYVALEFSVTEGYSGTAGTDIPEDEQVELMRLKRLAY
jgi:cytochrome c553